MAVVVDWLDACRKRDLASLLDLYAPNARIECQYGDAILLYQGRAELENYWRPLLEHLDLAAYKLQEIMPVADGVEIDYLDPTGTVSRTFFDFTTDGKIARMRSVASWPRDLNSRQQ